MAFPAGVITRPVTFGPAFELEDGDVAGMTVAFKATRPGVLWMETGSPAVSVAITRNASDGAEQTVNLPVTDQEGWGDGDGNAIIPGEDGHVFLYSVSIVFTQDGRTIPGAQPRSKTIAIPQGDGSPLDLDKIIPLTSPGGEVVSLPDIWSGQIAAAEAAASAAAASADVAAGTVAGKQDVATLSDDLAGKLGAPGDSFTVAVGGKIGTDALVKTGAQTVAGVKTFTDGVKVGDAGNRLVQIPGTDTMQIQGSTYVAGRFGVNGSGSPRIPAVITPTVDGATLPNDQLANKVAFAVNPVFKGGFTAEAGRGAPDPGFLFGSNVFVTTGSTAGDLAGITDLYGTLHEVHNYTPNSNLNVLLGAQSEGNNEGVGSTVVTGYSHRVKGYAARHGVTVNAISLYVGSPYTENEGTITGVNEALHVGGTAPSYFGGNVSLDNRTLDAGITSAAIVRARYLVASEDRAKSTQAAITAYAPSAASVGSIVVGFTGQTADLQRWQDAGGVIKAKVASNGVATFALIKAGGLDNTDGAGVKVTQNSASDVGLRVQAVASPTGNLTSWLTSSNGELFGITASGAPRWTATALAQTTVGSAGAASALPATPTKYLKVVDSTGATLVIPAYAAA